MQFHMNHKFELHGTRREHCDGASILLLCHLSFIIVIWFGFCAFDETNKNENSSDLIIRVEKERKREKGGEAGFEIDLYRITFLLSLEQK